MKEQKQAHFLTDLFLVVMSLVFPVETSDVDDITSKNFRREQFECPIVRNKNKGE